MNISRMCCIYITVNDFYSVKIVISSTDFCFTFLSQNNNEIVTFGTR